MVNEKPKVVFVIPMLNEEEGIGHTIDRIRAVMAQLGLPYHILVVDGGSTDKTVEVAKSKGAEVIRQREKGYGDAYISGFLQCKTTPPRRRHCGYDRRRRDISTRGASKTP